VDWVLVIAAGVVALGIGLARWKWRRGRPRTRRIILAVLVVLSVIVSLQWVRSHWWVDYFNVTRIDGFARAARCRSWTFGSQNTSVALFYDAQALRSPRGAWYQFTGDGWYTRCRFNVPNRGPYPPSNGFSYVNQSYTNSGQPVRVWQATAPWWFVALLAGALAGAFTWCDARRSRLERWAQTGCCVRCGYDLRTTPDRCPECGYEASTPIRHNQESGR